MTKEDSFTCQPVRMRKQPVLDMQLSVAASSVRRNSIDDSLRAPASIYMPTPLPLVGKSRWQQIRTLVPVSRETWRKLVQAKRAPQPERISMRCTVYDNGELHRWFADPAAYHA